MTWPGRKVKSETTQKLLSEHLPASRPHPGPLRQSPTPCEGRCSHRKGKDSWAPGALLSRDILVSLHTCSAWKTHPGVLPLQRGVRPEVLRGEWGPEPLTVAINYEGRWGMSHAPHLLLPRWEKAAVCTWPLPFTRLVMSEGGSGEVGNEAVPKVCAMHVRLVRPLSQCISQHKCPLLMRERHDNKDSSPGCWPRSLSSDS